MFISNGCRLSGLMMWIVLALSCAMVHAADGKLVLVEAGQARMPIIVYENAPPMTRRAADELADYIQKISGVRPDVIQGRPEPLPVHAIWVGYQPGLEKLFPDLDFNFQYPEEILIAANENHLVIAGRDRWQPGHLDIPSDLMDHGGGRGFIVKGVQQEYGTANAVFTFLHDELDVRWLWPGEVDVPTRSTVALAPFVHRHHPQMRSRTQIFWHLSRGRTGPPGHPESDWARFNRLQLDSLEAHAGEHGFSDWWERFGKTHPEYFALQPDGTRNGFPRPRQAKICESNPAVWDQWIKDVEAALAKNPGQVAFSAAANDSWASGHCTCESCRAWDDLSAPRRMFHWQGLGQEYVALADRQVRFANELGRKLKERFPDRKLHVAILAYGLSRPAPISVVPDDNVIIGSVANFCFDPRGVDRASSDNALQLDQYKAWSKVTSNLYWRPNVNRNIQNGVPLDTQVIMDHFRVLGETRSIGMQVDTLYRYWSLNGPAYHLMAQLAWNPHQDGQAVLDDYFRHGFGPAADDLKAYQTLLDDARGQHYANGNGADGASWAQAYTPDFFDQAQALLTQAAAKAAGQDKYVRRVAFMTVGLEFLKLQTQGRVLAERIKSGGSQKADAMAQLMKNWQRIEMIAKTQPYAISPQFLKGIRKQPVDIDPRRYQ